MFRVLARLKLSLNCHTDISSRSASNMRLYEVAGVVAPGHRLEEQSQGAVRADVEVVIYPSLEECVEKIDWFLERPVESVRIAEAWCRRTHLAHTYHHRASLLAELMRTHM